MTDKELFDTRTVRVSVPLGADTEMPSARIEDTGRHDRAILFADVSGSTKLYEQAGNEVAFAAINECIELMKMHTRRSAGRVVKTMGDEVMAVFPSADAAADAAIEMQLAVTDLPLIGGLQRGLRIGFHVGEFVEDDNDVFGDCVNVAARLTELASKGQIITSRETVDLLARALKASTRYIYGMPIRGKERNVDLYEVLWQQDEELTAMAQRTTTNLVLDTAKLRLVYGETELIFDRSKNGIWMGRDPAADLVIRDRMASRAHGKIERRADKFILSDQSSNGTYVTVDGDRELVLRREEFTLRGRGWICFGHGRAHAQEAVSFFCE